MSVKGQPPSDKNTMKTDVPEVVAPESQEAYSLRVDIAIMTILDWLFEVTENSQNGNVSGGREVTSPNEPPDE